MVENSEQDEPRRRLLPKDWHLSPTVSIGNLLVLFGWISLSIWIVAEIRAETQRNSDNLERHERKPAHDEQRDAFNELKTREALIEYRVKQLDAKFQKFDQLLQEIQRNQQKILFELRKEEER